jgi:hypothetical protein
LECELQDGPARIAAGAHCHNEVAEGSISWREAPAAAGLAGWRRASHLRARHVPLVLPMQH